jgi:hypothetical protein
LAALLTDGFPFAPFQFTDNTGQVWVLNNRSPDDRAVATDLGDGRWQVDYLAAPVVRVEHPYADARYDRLILSDDPNVSAVIAGISLTAHGSTTRTKMTLYDARAWLFADGVLAYLTDFFLAQAEVVAMIEQRRAALRELVAPTEPPAEDTPKPPGRHPLKRDELTYRLAAAQEAEELKARDPAMTWKEIAKEICWRPGWKPAGVKLLEDARKRLARLQKDDPEHLLDAVSQRRKRKET